MSWVVNKQSIIPFQHARKIWFLRDHSMTIHSYSLNNLPTVTYCSKIITDGIFDFLLLTVRTVKIIINTENAILVFSMKQDDKIKLLN